MFFIAMAKHGKRKYRAYIRGPVDISKALGSTLGANTAILAGSTGVLQEKAYLTSVVLKWSLGNLTPVANAGPIVCGVAHSDYSISEIEAWIENDAGWSQGDLTAQEIAKRKIRQVGVFETPDAITDQVVLNDGKHIHTKCGWMLFTGDGRP